MGRHLPLIDLCRQHEALVNNAPRGGQDVESEHWERQLAIVERRILREPAIDDAHLLTKLRVWEYMVERPELIDPDIHLPLFAQLIEEARALLAHQIAESA